MIGNSQGRHPQLLGLYQKSVQSRSAVKKAVLGMHVEVNELHGLILIEYSAEKPTDIHPAQLIYAIAPVDSDDAHQELDWLFLPPLRRLPPPAKYALNPVQTTTPEECSYL
jgi:hypothetical protein